MSARGQPSPRDCRHHAGRGATETPLPQAAPRMKPVPQNGRETAHGPRPLRQPVRTIICPHHPWTSSPKSATSLEASRQATSRAQRGTCPFLPVYLLATSLPGWVLECDGHSVPSQPLPPGPLGEAPWQRGLQRVIYVPKWLFILCPLPAHALGGSPFPQPQMTVDSSSNKNKYVCLFPGACDGAEPPRGVGGIDGPVPPASRAHLLPTLASSDGWLSHEHKTVDRIYKHFSSTPWRRSRDGWVAGCSRHDRGSCGPAPCHRGEQTDAPGSQACGACLPGPSCAWERLCRLTETCGWKGSLCQGHHFLPSHPALRPEPRDPEPEFVSSPWEEAVSKAAESRPGGNVLESTISSLFLCLDHLLLMAFSVHLWHSARPVLTRAEVGR